VYPSGGFEKKKKNRKAVSKKLGIKQKPYILENFEWLGVVGSHRKRQVDFRDRNADKRNFSNQNPEKIKGCGREKTNTTLGTEPKTGKFGGP